MVLSPRGIFLKSSMPESLVLLRAVIARCRELFAGLIMPTRGGCVCDPVAWERDARIRMSDGSGATRQGIHSPPNLGELKPTGREITGSGLRR
jgi:hypothetical protein